MTRTPPVTSSRPRKSTERIDGIVALIMAIGRAMLTEEAPYAEDQLFFV
jgi:hypothetical protein